MDKLIELLKERHGGALDFKDGQVYYLFLQDGLFSVYLEEDTKTLKVDIEVLPEGNTFIYHSLERLEGLVY